MHGGLIEYAQERTRFLLAPIENPVIIIGLSGGCDSVFLLRALAPLHATKELSLHAIYINHGWRESALEDQDFCAALCARYGIPFHTEHVAHWTTKAAPQKIRSGSKEADAREIRRLILEAERQRLHADAIALAHHAEDQIETFFIRLIRGGGLSGLCGMKERSGAIIRPLLLKSKTEILSWLNAHHQPWRTDETNESMHFLRNRIRSILLPALALCDGRARDSVLKAMQNLTSEEEVLSALSRETLHALKQPNGMLDTARFLGQKTGVRARILTDLLIATAAPFTPSQKLFQEIERFLKSRQGGTHTITSTIVVQKAAGQFTIYRADQDEPYKKEPIKKSSRSSPKTCSLGVPRLHRGTTE